MPHLLPSNRAILPGMADIDLEAIGVPSIPEICDIYCKQYNIHATASGNTPLLDEKDVNRTLSYYLVINEEKTQ